MTLTAILPSLRRVVELCGTPCSIFPSARGRLLGAHRTIVTVLRAESGKRGKGGPLAGVITANARHIQRHSAFSATVAGAARETVAEGVGFEPTRHFCPPVFKTGSIGRSDSPPEYNPSLADAPKARLPP